MTAARRHFAHQRGKDIVPIFAHHLVSEGGGADQHESEKQSGCQVTHIFSPVLSTA
ncbi:hypothetical protein SH591_01480 [Sphingomonas sp. LY54]|uniref:hypothetical protein n=1 Tax=Sphingomonas sp. LY54 TaxID=3095343 RepID=UPI002D78CA45|nr:hypothetical protein [Sphingomonas sp. LY54]WRP28881.1 hypothetical protein SH591_01480 [Sphingomonas sp. LY54]